MIVTMKSHAALKTNSIDVKFCTNILARTVVLQNPQRMRGLTAWKSVRRKWSKRTDGLIVKKYEKSKSIPDSII